MAEIIPFRGVLYNREKIGDLESVIAPPWDVISAELQEELYRRSQWNVVRLILGKQFPDDNEQDNKYTRAKKFWNDWLQEGILAQDTEPSIYACQDEYSLSRDERRARQGFIALAKLEDFGSGTFWPHERTFEQARVDRLKLIRECAANFSPIFSLYSDSNLTLDRIISAKTERRPEIEVRDDDGTKRRLWRIADPEVIEKIVAGMKGKSVFIADGHHRYETALTFRNQIRDKPRKVWNYPWGKYWEKETCDYVLMYFCNIHDPGLTILPVHRMVRSVPQFNLENLLVESGKFFYVEQIDGGCRRLFEEMRLRRGNVFGLYVQVPLNKGNLTGQGGFFLLTLRDEKLVDELAEDKPEEWRRLDVAVLHTLLIEHILGISSVGADITYTREREKAVKLVDEGKYQLVAFLNPIKAEQMHTVASQGERLPPKSTYFYPKIPSGLVMNKIL